jgi:DNA-binding transcriptional regulator GbsR (MarR family)
MEPMPDALNKSRALFIRRWGEMGGYWGINRTMAELHALLYTSAGPLCTDDIMELLQISRGNASMNLRQLIDWGLISRIHRKGDRKEYFVCEADVWEMFENIARERKRREMEPIVETIRRCREMVQAESDGGADEKDDAVKVYLARLDAMEDFLGNALNLMNLVLNKRMKNLRSLAAFIGKFVPSD